MMHERNTCGSLDMGCMQHSHGTLPHSSTQSNAARACTAQEIKRPVMPVMHLIKHQSSMPAVCTHLQLGAAPGT